MGKRLGENIVVNNIILCIDVYLVDISHDKFQLTVKIFLTYECVMVNEKSSAGEKIRF